MRRRITLITAACLVAFVAACNDSTTPLETDGPLLSKKGGHGGGGNGGGGDPPPASVSFADGPGHRITSDGRGDYIAGECGVAIATFSLQDLILTPAAGKIRPKEAAGCGGTRDARTIKLDFSNPASFSAPNPRDGSILDGVFMNVDRVENITIADGVVLRTLGFNGVCSTGIRFDPAQYPGTNLVEVFKNPDDTSWTVRSQAASNDVAVCYNHADGGGTADSAYYHMPFELTVTVPTEN